MCFIAREVKIEISRTLIRVLTRCFDVKNFVIGRCGVRMLVFIGKVVLFGVVVVVVVVFCW